MESKLKKPFFSPLWRFIEEYRFQFLLLNLLVLYAVLPFFEVALLIDIVAAVIILVALVAVIGNRLLWVICLSLEALAIAAIWAVHWYGRLELAITANILDLAVVVIITSVILARVFKSPVITRETLAGAISGYLMIGFMWALLFTILSYLHPESFSMTISQSLGEGQISSPRLQTTHFSYFSLVTLSTLGYGDIVPLTRPARALASLEAIIGQLYLAVLVARLVGQLMATDKINDLKNLRS